ncbi:MAG: hypothetical protein IJ328_04975 [Muribaculaceae bacterium]|nr:hypothetical protein [Muribaculaceae bacterium]
MKKIFLPIVVCLATAMSANAVDAGNANIYASGLKVLNGGSDVQFVLNAPGDVTVNFYKEGVTDAVYSISKTGLEKGTHTVSLTGVLPDAVKEGDQLSWEVVASAEAKTAWVGFSAKAAGLSEIPADQKMCYPVGIAVDKNPKSPFFGNIYLLNNNSGTVGGFDVANSNLGTGVYIYNSLIECQNPGENHETVYSGGVNWGNTLDSDRCANISVSPADITVDDDGFVYISDMSTETGGVYRMNPANPESDFEKILTVTTDNHNGVCGLAVIGTGDEKTLWTVNMNLAFLSDTERPLSGYLYKYNLNKLANDKTYTGEKVLEIKDYTMGGRNNTYLAPDRRGGVWLAQRWNSSSRGYFTLVHVNKNSEVSSFGNLKYWDDYFGTFTKNTISAYAMGLDTNSDGTKVVIGVYGAIGVQDITYDEKGNVATYENSSNYLAGYSGNSNNNSKINHLVNGVAYDAVGNVYVADWSDYFQAYASLPAENKYTTPANEHVTVSKEMTGVESTIADENAPVEYFNMQGVKVNAPENGIFIKKQAGKTTKVIL